ncbi:MAG: dipeptide epimerase [Candidatus Latescibacteria bacterium]|nr:dipeptide epimerase [Candidatus Latescibacterota bacterium]NIM21171.1 dipeptide epimerase [Candidatus Latescibacterota bacterium]NIM65306.1 dipeptide epimerase [Candidatus Latescibacterota bacterium]NIO01821.1 dipeptide epimerase [Candidatus Latescibacterota bacterium]NIO28338.1 dipeptide epimerase [Candidatus Latescibacterota bacterium]
MKITSIDIYKADIPFHEPFRIAIMEFTSAESLFIKINTSEGLYGMGEANPTPVITGETQAINLAGAVDLAKLILNKDPLDIETRMRDIDKFLVHNSTLRSAFDIALYDLLGKSASLPLYAVLGGGKRSFWTDNTIGINDPEYMADKALDYRKQGFKAIKVKLGTTMAEDVERIARIRKALGDNLPIRIDANQGWDYKTATATLNALELMGIEYCEQPIAHWDYENMRRIRQNTSIAIMADESLFDHHDAYKLASMGCCDYFNIKLAKSGGIHTALKINAIAEGAGIQCMMGSMTETRLGLTAAAHVVSARPNIRYADLDGFMFLKEDPVVGGSEYDVGEIHVPEVPGHGADIDPKFLKRCECVTVK